MKTKFFTLAVIAGLLTACASDDTPETKYITVNTGITPMSRIVTNADKTQSFSDGDRISIYAWTGSAATIPAERVVDGIVNTLGKDVWIPAAPMVWADESTPHYLMGIHPASSTPITDFTAGTFTLGNDLTQNDLMVATQAGTDGKGIVPQAAPVSLQFSHLLARLTVNVTYRTQFSKLTEATVNVSSRTNATVDYLNKTVVVTGESSNLPMTDIVANANGQTRSYEAIMIPQAGVTTINIMVEGTKLTYTHTQTADIELTSSKHTTVNLTVGRDKVELTGISIDPWDDSSSSPIEGGEITDPDPIG